MLQQTQVETAIPYYERFLQRFPSIEALALADEQDVLREWAGLGYYARARNLKRAAEQVLRDHAGELPRDRDALLALPGVGPYTAGALRSIAFRQQAPIVDGNVARVLARLLAEPTPSISELWEQAGELVPARRPDLFNQALMELGATICTPRSPRCDACPIGPQCSGLVEHRPEAYPAPKRRRPPKRVRAVAGALWRGRRKTELLMVRRPSRGLLGGLWELPSTPGRQPAALLRDIEKRTGLRARSTRSLGELKHAFTHRALTLEVLELESRPAGRKPAPRATGDAEVRWCSAEKLADLPLSALMRKALSLAGAAPPPRPAR